VILFVSIRWEGEGFCMVNDSGGKVKLINGCIGRVDRLETG
jgi:hypothetical protein